MFFVSHKPHYRLILRLIFNRLAFSYKPDFLGFTVEHLNRFIQWRCFLYNFTLSSTRITPEWHKNIWGPNTLIFPDASFEGKVFVSSLKTYTRQFSSLCKI